MPRTANSVWSPAIVVAYVVVAAGLTSSRLFSVLHAESSAVVACAAFFLSGLHVASRSAGAPPNARVLAAHLSYLSIPWLVLTASLLWVPNCAYWTGLAIYLAYTVPSVILGFALASAIGVHVRRFGRTIFIVAGIAIALGGTIYDLALHPQFYVLNHVYGGILGPIYEDALYIRPGLFAFRALTLLWALVLLILSSGHWRGEAQWWPFGARRGAIVGITGLSIGLIYLFAPELGINTPSWYLQRTLQGKLETEHFDLYFSPRAIDEEELRAVAYDHEYRYDWLSERLGVAPEERIQSYLYPTVSEKIRLTGAGLTDVSPVWLRNPQMHLLQSTYGETMGHELVHVFSREFGLPVIRASWLVGLVEGLAVALEPPSGESTVRDQMSVAAQRARGSDIGLEPALAPAVVRMMSASSFWTARGAVSYTTAGSFVAYLIGRYGADQVRDVYAWGDFRRVYGRSLVELAHDWERYIRRTPLVSIAADDLVMRRFTLPSLFEVDCPHYQPRHVAAHRDAVDLLVVGDTLEAESSLATALQHEPRYAPSLTVWSLLRLAEGEHGRVVEQLRSLPDTLFTPALRVYYGDALALGSDPVHAMRQYEAALEALPLDARDARMMVVARTLGGGNDLVAAAFYGSGPLPEPPHEESRYVAARVGASLRAAAGGLFDRASNLAAIEAIPEHAALNAAEQELFLRMASVWAGLWARRSGDPATAARYLQRARASARRVGDLAHVAELDDQLQKTAWFGRMPSNVAMALIDLHRVSETSRDGISLSHADEVVCR